MTLTGISFVLFFFIAFNIYYLVPVKKQWYVLLAASLCFYGLISIKMLFILLLVSIISYLAAIFHKKKFLFWCLFLLTLFPLVLFKYAAFFSDSLNIVFSLIKINMRIPQLNFLLPLMPVGISFWTFISLSYCIDVQQNDTHLEKNFLKHLLYISFFGYITSGPIVKHNEVANQLYIGYKFEISSAISGLKRIAFGYFKKLCIADAIGSVITPDIALTNTGITVFISLILFSLQLYFDFSGYTDIVIGCSKMLGIKLPENFNAPYFSKSITEFWRRWHITLGEWFKSYLFYPFLRTKFIQKISDLLDWNKYLKKTIPTCIALFVFWFTVGLWHGASFGFIFYGLFHGSFMIFSTIIKPLVKDFYKKLPFLKNNPLWSLFQIIRTYILVCLGYSFFWTGGFPKGITIIRNLFISENSYYSIPLNLGKLILPVLFSIIILGYEQLRYVKPESDKLIKDFYNKCPKFIKYIVYSLIILCISALIIRERDYASFIYYKF